MTHLLVTNDFPPKVGGIQTYLWELWRRLPPGEAVVLTARSPDAGSWDGEQPFPIVRTSRSWLLPTRGMADEVRRVAQDVGAKLVVLDPALPLGLIGPGLGIPYAVVVHGAEITVPGRLPVGHAKLARVLGGARGVIAAGPYPHRESARAAGGEDRVVEFVDVPPGVDTVRFHPVDEAGRRAARASLGLPEDGPLIVSASRLVPRKGMDVLIQSLPHLVAHRPDLTLAIAGAGRDARRLRTLAARLGVARRVRMLGRVDDADLPSVYAAGDVFAMVCRDRWGGLEQEGFGIVFLEAAACGVPQVAGDSGGAPDAVEDDRTGIVVRTPKNPEAVAAALARLLDDEALRVSMGAAARARAVEEFEWGTLAGRLAAAIKAWTP